MKYLSSIFEEQFSKGLVNIKFFLNPEKQPTLAQFANEAIAFENAPSIVVTSIDGRLKTTDYKTLIQ
jgi:hypothetical protein